MKSSIADIRAHFPALGRRQNGEPVAYFDGPGGTQVTRSVGDAMADYLFHHNANTHWVYPTSEETDAIVLRARETFADFLNAAPNEIVFGANMTTLTFHLARAIGRGLQYGDEIVVTELDHHANVAPWRELRQERGVTIRVAKMDPAKGELDWNDFSRHVNARTKLIAIGAASNALGTVNDVRRAAELARKFGAQVFVDAVAYAPHALVDVREFDCDFLACSAYKFYGPHVGILYGRHELLAALDFPKLLPSPDYAPDRAETGTQNFEGIAGATAAVEFLASQGEGATRREKLSSAFAGLHARAETLFAQLWEGLAGIRRVRLYGPPPATSARMPAVAFTVDGIPSIDVARHLAQRGVFASNGDFYATTVIERLGETRDGLVRAGCACYTTDEEVTRLIDGVRELQPKTR